MSDKKKNQSEQMTTAMAGIPQDTKNMGPKRFSTTNVMDRRRKKKPALLKRFRAHVEEK